LGRFRFDLEQFNIESWTAGKDLLTNPCREMPSVSLQKQTLQNPEGFAPPWAA
jgi:hypothetical protein